MRRRLLLAVLALLVCAAPAPASTFLPPKGKIWHGVAGGHTVDLFQQQTGKPPAIFQLFVSWGNVDWAFNKARAQDGRLMLHLSTANGQGAPEKITPAQIAAGRGDDFLWRLNRKILEHGGPVYLRVMAEMNGHWNQYAAFDANGRPRPGHSTRDFRRAWRRIARIVRSGGARVSLLWVPQVAGAPDTRANAPRAYWPGSRWVDWVGTDFYSKFPNWSGLDRFHREFRHKPFAFGEYAVWGRDDPAFLRRVFAWSRARRNVRMLIYNHGVNPVGPFRLRHYPRSRATLRALLRARRYPAARARTGLASRPSTAWTSGVGADAAPVR